MSGNHLQYRRGLAKAMPTKCKKETESPIVYGIVKMVINGIMFWSTMWSYLVEYFIVFVITKKKKSQFEGHIVNVL